MRRLILLAACLFLVTAPAYAQPRPIAATTIQTTDTSGNSALIGCALGSTTCTGGIKAGPVDASSIILGAGGISIASGTPAVTTLKLYQASGSLFWNGIALATGSSLSGTTGKIPVFTAANAVGDSILVQSGGNTITMAGTMVATTFSGSGASLTALPAAQLTGTITSATQDLITRTGTITSGTWTGTAIDVTRGGAGVSLAGTGGTSQFLRQNSAGATITVVRPAVSDLSDASNVALLNAANTFTGGNLFQANAIAWPTSLLGQSAGRVALTGSGGNALLILHDDTAVAAGIGTSGIFFTGRTNDTGPAYASYANIVATKANATQGNQLANLLFKVNTGSGLATAWGINAAGDFTVGASSHIADSVGTPARLSGCGGGTTIAGIDSAFTMSKSTGSDASCVIQFGHTWTTAPICTASVIFGNVPVLTVVTSTSAVTLGYAASSAIEGFQVLCRSY